MVVEEWKKSGIATKFPTYRNSKLITSQGYFGWRASVRMTKLRAYGVLMMVFTTLPISFINTLEVPSGCKKPKIIHLALLISMFVFAVASVKFNSWLYTILAGTTLCWTVISAHNYFHRRDNWRMYTFNLSMMNFCAWRISHAMSHHIYPNSYLDLELSMFEPFLCWVPNLHIKSLMMRYVSWVTEPLVYAIAMYLQIGTRIVYSLLHTNIMYWHDIISLSIPLSMYLSSDWNLLMCIRQWLLITAIASAAFCIIGLNAAHHDPRIHHEGDANREDRDWGLFQVDTIIDRGDLKKSQFLVLTHFGDHALHHLFPTLDHGILPQLYPVLYQTLDEFKGELRECNHLEHILGQHRQLLRIQPNLLPPGSQKL
ncbi:cytochrome b5-related protein isoform X2 [Stomoxys calcitrans]|uniref:Fatty acid desaturase domain-containing protein n=1 Tax=Stomoxys calcitrans TaxID=35570 RepID=A0A1I8PVW8_STOCA|nr:cytochrome b5-related protein isoform X2 [Stomoxys calcitrans]